MKLKNHPKTIMAILTALMMLCSALLIPTLAFRPGQSPKGADFAVFEGVAGSDYYDSSQYSYQVNQWYSNNVKSITFYPNSTYFNASKSLRIGMPSYGEFATPVNGGLAYGANATEWSNTESWASAAIPQAYWIQGWVLYLNYTRVGTGLRCLEAWGLYSDLSNTEAGRNVYTWNGNYQSSDNLANLTQGSLIASGVEVLYDSARLVVARATVIIHDNAEGGASGEDVCQVTFTLYFNKDSKYAIVYKDYKTLLHEKVFSQMNDFAFSERYELDLAAEVNPSDASYIHYYHNVNSTVYQHPLTGDGSYDAIQAFDPQNQYIYFAGYWPNATEYSVYDPTIVPNPSSSSIGTTVLPLGTAVADVPGSPQGPGEPHIPWIVVQWRYNSTNHPNLMSWLQSGNTTREIRFVEAIGMTDFNTQDPYPAKDANATGTYGVTNQIDEEVQYTLYHEVFNPEDINSLSGSSTSPFMYTSLGQTSGPADSAGSSVLGGAYGQNRTTLPLFDKNDTLGSIPYGLTTFNGTYYEQFSNVGKGTGVDTTLYKRTGLMGFVPGTDEEIETGTTAPPQPVAGGWDFDSDAWYPSKDPLTEAWSYSGTAFSTAQYDNINYHPNGILNLGGPKANQLTRYFNDFGFAITREGTTPLALIHGGTVTGTTPTSDPNQGTIDFFPLSTWNTEMTGFNYSAGYAVISLVRDINGTRGLSVYGWDGRDTFWAAAWASQYIVNATTGNWLPPGTVALILHMTYTGPNLEPSMFTVVKALGTITEFGTDAFRAAATFDGKGTLAWTGVFAVPDTYDEQTPSHVWWYQKLPSTSTAKVDFDP